MASDVMSTAADLRSEPTAQWLQASPEVIFARIGDEGVLLNVATGIYYSLNPVGALIWGGIVSGMSIPAIRSRLLLEFHVPDADLSADLVRFVGDLTRLGLATAGGL